VTTTDPATHHGWHVGHNLPGYLPESDVYHVDDWADARDMVAEDMDDYADALETWADDHDCDDVPCPTYGDDCAWQRAQNVRTQADLVRLLTSPQDLCEYADGIVWWATAADDDDDCDREEVNW